MSHKNFLRSFEAAIHPSLLSVELQSCASTGVRQTRHGYILSRGGGRQRAPGQPWSCYQSDTRDHTMKCLFREGSWTGRERLELPQVPSHKDQALASAFPHLQPLQHPKSGQNEGPMSLSRQNTDLRQSMMLLTTTWWISHPKSFSFVIHLCGYKSAHKLYHSKCWSRTAELDLDIFFFSWWLPGFFESKSLRSIRRRVSGYQENLSLQVLYERGGWDGEWRKRNSFHC